MEVYDSLALGIGLGAAAGFRVFLPLLTVNFAIYLGIFHPEEELLWLATWGIGGLFFIALVLEIAWSYYTFTKASWDMAKVTLAVIGGTFLAGIVLSDVASVIRWPAAIILGGGTAGILQGTIALLRDMMKKSDNTSQILMGGLEVFLAFIIALCSFFFSLFTGIAVLIFVLFVLKRIFFRPVRKDLI